MSDRACYCYDDEYEGVVCDNCGAPAMLTTVDVGRFCDQACSDAYEMF